MSVSYTHLDVYKRQPLACDDCGVFMLMAGREVYLAQEYGDFRFIFGRGSGGVEGQHGRAFVGESAGNCKLRGGGCLLRSF